MDDLKKKYEKDRLTWDECAETYENQIVGGHPDITAFEEFEEDFLDRLLRYLAETQKRPIKLMDIGCGSGRLHIRYGTKTVKKSTLLENHPITHYKAVNPKLGFDPLLSEKLQEVWGIDFSSSMIKLAEEKVSQLGLNLEQKIKLTLVEGSAFDLVPESEETLPVAVNLVNSIGVTQGPSGAVELFKAMRKAVEAAEGIAIISNYQQEYVAQYALGQYESTLDVSGQPRWLVRDTYASDRYKKVAIQYKQAHSQDPTLLVDVYDFNGNRIEKEYLMRRDPELTAHVINTGEIRTYSNYESHWYSYQQMDDWIKTYWDPANSFHIKTRHLDRLRAEPAQFSILDCGNHLQGLFKRWELGS